MLAVSNTSPLRYLIAVEQAELLPGLFGEILIPPGVAEELSDRGAPPAVSRWIASAPHRAWWVGPRSTPPKGPPRSTHAAPPPQKNGRGPAYLGLARA